MLEGDQLRKQTDPTTKERETPNRIENPDFCTDVGRVVFQMEVEEQVMRAESENAISKNILKRIV